MPEGITILRRYWRSTSREGDRWEGIVINPLMSKIGRIEVRFGR